MGTRINTFFGAACCAALLGSVGASAQAQEFVGMHVEPGEIAVHRSAELTLEFKERENQREGRGTACNLLVNYGDGNSENIRVEAGKTPVKIAHTYDTVGNFAISAEGKTKFRGFNTLGGCSGSHGAVALTVREENYAEKVAVEEAEQKAAYERAAADKKAARAAATAAAAERANAEAAARSARRERTAADAAARRAVAEKAAAQQSANAAAMERKSAEARARAAAEANARTEAPPPAPPPEAPKKGGAIKANSSFDL